MFDFELGQFVTDNSTGFKGIINGRCIWNTGNIQYSIGPMVDKDGELRESKWIDGDHLLVDLKKGIGSKYEDPCFKFENGDEVKAFFVNFKGTIQGKIQWLNGCLEYSIIARELDKEHKTIYKTFAEEDILLYRKAKNPVKIKSSTGGPIRSSKTHITSRNA